MVQHKHFKSRVRARMVKTGESYTTARRHLLATRPDGTSTGADRPGGHPGNPAGTHYDAALWQRVLAASGVHNPASDAPFSEAMLAGLAGGIGFMVATFSYESITTATVVLRAHPEPYTERLLDRTGVTVERLHTGSAKTAQSTLDRVLDAGRPVIVRATHGALPWIDSEAIEYLESIDVAVMGRVEEDHPAAASGRVGAYLVQGGGRHPGDDPEGDAGPHLALPGELAAARAARKADRHWAAWVDPAGVVAPSVDQLAGNVRDAVAATTGRLLGTLPLEGVPASWGPKFGVAGMRTWAALLRDDRTKKGWPGVFSDAQRLRTGLEMVQGFLAGSRWGGSGGLRGLYADFLTEAAQLPGLAALATTAPAYRDLAPRWDALADAVDPGIEVGDRVAHFSVLADHLEALAEAEEAAARALAGSLQH